MNSHHPIKEEELPSGQSDTTNRAGSSQDEEFESLGILTQYIGLAQPANSTSKNRDNTEQNIDKLTNKFKAKYEELVDSLDRAKGHKLSFEQARQRGRTPNKLQITIKPMVVNRDNAEFQSDWDKAVKKSEGILLDALQTHLGKFIQTTNERIRETTKQTWLEIKAIDKDRASPAIKTALQQCEEQHIQKADNRRKRKEEALQKQPAKKTKTEK